MANCRRFRDFMLLPDRVKNKLGTIGLRHGGK
jgi:hypothetical protein